MKRADCERDLISLWKRAKPIRAKIMLVYVHHQFFQMVLKLIGLVES